MKTKNTQATDGYETLSKEENTTANKLDVKDDFADKTKTQNGEPLTVVNDQLETGILVNAVAEKYENIKEEERPKLSAEEMDKALTDVKMTDSKVGFFKRGKRQENFEKRRDYEKEYKGFYDKMVADSESETDVIMSDYKKEKGSGRFASHERKTPYLALRMKQLKEMGEYDGDVDTAEFMKNMDVYVDDALLKEEDKTEEGQTALKIRRDKKAKEIEKIGDYIKSWDIRNFDISSPEAILKDKAKLQRDLPKLQLCEEFDVAINSEYPKLMEKGCDCKYSREELIEIQALTFVYMGISQLYTTYLRIADNPYFAKVLDDELDGLGDLDFQDNYKTKRYLDLMNEGKKSAEIESDTLYKYFTCLNFIRNIKFSKNSLKIGDNPVAAVKRQKKALSS